MYSFDNIPKEDFKMTWHMVRVSQFSEYFHLWCQCVFL